MFSVAVFGAPPLFYQWQRNGTNLMDGGNLSGAASRILVLTSASFADAGTYSVTVTNVLGSAASTGALLKVVPPPAFQAVGLTNGSLALSWSAAVGQKYRLQYKPSLTASNWLNLGNLLTASSTVMTATDPIGTNAQRFYRVVLFPQ